MTHSAIDLDPPAALVEQLRAELADRPLSIAHRCPSWPRFARWLHTHDQPALGQWLTLALAPTRTTEQHRQLGELAGRVLTELDGDAEQSELAQLWAGELGWSWWLGPFMLAFVDGVPARAERLEQLLGPLGLLLAPARVLSEGRGVELQFELEPGRAMLLPTTLPGEQIAVYELALRAARSVHDQRAVTNDEVQWVWQRGFISYREQPSPPTGSHAVVSLPSESVLEELSFAAVDALASAVVVGPPELVSRWPRDARAQHWHQPADTFELGWRALASPQPALIQCLRDELAKRPLAEAHGCPSWPVLLDWLLAEGHAALAQWLRLALAGPGSPAETQLDRRLSEGPLAAARPSLRERLGALWSRRGQRTHWLGPFMLAYFDPQLEDRIGAVELQTSLGIHATFLARERVFTSVASAWIEGALLERERPVLAPVPAPNASVTIANLIARHGRPSRDTADSMRVTMPKEQLRTRPQRVIATNVGPLAADDESVALLCCESAEDLHRHAHARSELDNFDGVVILAQPALLDAWPHPAHRLEPWPALESSM